MLILVLPILDKHLFEKQCIPCFLFLGGSYERKKQDMNTSKIKIKTNVQ